MWQTVKRGSCSKNQETDRMSNQFLVRLNFPSIHEPSALDNKTRLQEYHYHDLKSCCQQVETSLYIANKLQPKLTFCVLKQGLTGRGKGQKFIGELGDTLCKMVLRWLELLKFANLSQRRKTKKERRWRCLENSFHIT